MPMKEQVEVLKRLIEAPGFEARSYSGRGMFGATCLAFDIDRDTNEFEAVALILETVNTDDVDELDILIYALKSARSDSMGLGMVIYFPNFEYTEEEEDEKDETDK